jgi:hypothetical protein
VSEIGAVEGIEAWRGRKNFVIAYVLTWTCIIAHLATFDGVAIRVDKVVLLPV